MQSDETAPQPEQPRSAEPAQLESLEAELEALRRERDDLEQKLLRVTADYQNYVRRSGQHAQDAADQKLVDVARALLTVLDHFDHALDVVDRPTVGCAPRCCSSTWALSGFRNEARRGGRG